MVLNLAFSTLPGNYYIGNYFGPRDEG